MSISNKENFIYCLRTITRFFKTVCNDKELFVLHNTIKFFDGRYCQSYNLENESKKRFKSDVITRWLFLELKTIDEIVKLDRYNVLYLSEYTNGVGKPICFVDIEQDKNLLCLVLLIRLSEYMRETNHGDKVYCHFCWFDKIELFYKENIQS